MFARKKYFVLISGFGGFFLLPEPDRDERDQNKQHTTGAGADQSRVASLRFRDAVAVGEFTPKGRFQCSSIGRECGP